MTPLRTVLLFVLGVSFLPVLTANEPSTPEKIPAPQALDSHGDPLPDGAGARFGTVRFRHGITLHTVQFALDGQSVLSIAVDDSIRAWDIASGKDLSHCRVPSNNLRRFQNERGSVVAPDGKTACVSDGYRTLEIIDVASGTVRHKIVRVADRFLTPIVYSRDARHIAVGVQDDNGKGSVQTYEVATGNAVRSYAPPPPAKEDEGELNPQSAAFSADGTVLAAQGLVGNNNEFGMCLWEVATGKVLPRPEKMGGLYYGGMNLAALSPDGKHLAAVIFDEKNNNTGEARLWEVATGKLVRVLADTTVDNQIFLAFSPDGKTLAIRTTPLQLIDVATGKKLPLPDHEGERPIAVVFSPDSQRLALATSGDVVLYCELATGKVVHKLSGYSSGAANFANQDEFGNGAGSIAFSLDGAKLAGTGPAGTVRLWDMTTGKALDLTGAGHAGEVVSLAVSTDGKLLASGGGDNTVRVWDRSTGKELHRFTGPKGGNSDQTGRPVAGASFAVAFAPNGKTLAAGWTNGSIQLWDLATGKGLHQLSGGHDAVVNALAFSRDGKRLASTGWDGRAFWWDVERGKVFYKLAGPQAGAPMDGGGEVQPPRHGALSPDGRMLGTVGIDGVKRAVQLFELTTGEMRRNLPMKSPVSEALTQLEASLVGGIVLSRTGSYSQINNLVYIDFDISSHIAFAPDGRTLAFSSGNAIRLWDPIKGKEIRQFGGQEARIYGLAFAPRGDLVAGASVDGTVRLWDVATGNVRCTLPGHRGGALCLAFTPDGQTLLSGGSDCSVLSWDLTYALRESAAPAPLSEREIATLWDRLAAKDGKAAYDAIDRLALTPQPVVNLVRQRVQPVRAIDPRKIEQLLNDLEDKRFDVRRHAGDELEKLADQAEPFLRKRLAGNPPLEVQQRIDQVLTKISAPTTAPEKLRAMRAVELLETVGTPEAIELLQQLARGAAEARLTQDAREAVERLTRRAAP